MQPEGFLLDHVALPVFQAEQSLRFYRDVLGLPLIAAHAGDDWGGFPWLMMIFGLGDGRQLALFALHGAPQPAPDGLPRELRHLAVCVPGTTELARWKRRLAQHRVAFWEEDHGTQQSVYFEDPNGSVLEITTPASHLVTEPDPGALAVVETWLKQSPG